MTGETEYVLDPVVFTTTDEARVLIRLLEDTLESRGLGTADVVELLSEDDNPWDAGDMLRIYTAGGGGWSEPLEREIQSVEKDLQGGFVSLDAARSEYGVVIDPEIPKADQPRHCGLSQ